MDIVVVLVFAVAVAVALAAALSIQFNIKSTSMLIPTQQAAVGSSSLDT